MTRQKAEELYIRSLDGPLTEPEKTTLAKAFRDDPELAGELAAYRTLRERLRTKTPATFGPFFAARVLNAIGQSGDVLDRYLYTFFRKFQLAAAGMLIALLAANIMLAEQHDLMSILGLGDTPQQEEDVVAFDFFNSLNEGL